MFFSEIREAILQVSRERNASYLRGKDRASGMRLGKCNEFVKTGIF